MTTPAEDVADMLIKMTLECGALRKENAQLRIRVEDVYAERDMALRGLKQQGADLDAMTAMRDAQAASAKEWASRFKQATVGLDLHHMDPNAKRIVGHEESYCPVCGTVACKVTP